MRCSRRCSHSRRCVRAIHGQSVVALTEHVRVVRKAARGVGQDLCPREADAQCMAACVLCRVTYR